VSRSKGEKEKKAVNQMMKMMVVEEIAKASLKKLWEVGSSETI